MEIKTQVTLPFPCGLVYRTYRDHLLDVTPYLSNVRQIEVQSRQEQASGLHLVLIWHGGGEIPLAARTLLSDALLSWTDITDWDDRALTTAWHIQTHAFTEAVHCLGQNRFIDQQDRTLIVSEGTLTIDPKKFPVSLVFWRELWPRPWRIIWDSGWSRIFSNLPRQSSSI